MTVPFIDTPALERFCYDMVRERRFDLRVQERFHDATVKGTAHSCGGWGQAFDDLDTPIERPGRRDLPMP